MAKKKTDEEFILEIKTHHPDISVCGIYINNATKIECFCNKCKTTFFKSPNYLLSKHGCPSCADTRMTLNIFKERLSKINNKIEVIGKYTNARTKIECLCLIDGNTWSSTPDSLLKGHGCKICGNKRSSIKQMKNRNDFEREFYAVHSELKIISKYIGSRKKIKLKCINCGLEFDRTAFDALKPNYGCPKCNKSFGEKNIEVFLNKHDIEYVTQKKYDNLLGVGGKNLSFDFYLPQKNLLIEYQGEFHDGTAWQQDEDSFNIQQEHDKRKKIYSNDNSIDLLEIWYWDFTKIDSILFDAVFGGELDDSNS